MTSVKKVERTYVAIDLKSFYASVECMERGLDPMKTHLVVADSSRTEKTICLAVTPSLKKYGISGRARLFEVVEAVKKANTERMKKIGVRSFSDFSYNEEALYKDETLGIDFRRTLHI